MNEDRLLERIRKWKADPARRGRGNVRKQIDSIVSHLKKILNTRQGNVPIALDYGVPDLSTFMQDYPDSIRDIEEGIRHTIAAYETRLDKVNVIFIPQEDDVLSLRFQVIARLKGESGKDIKIETIVDADGKFNVKH